MPFMPQTVTQNIVVGAGRVMIGVLDANDQSQGMIYRGETPVFSINAASENVSVDSSDGPVKTRLVDVPVGITYSGTLALRNITDENLKTFLMGEIETITQAATPVVDESLTAVQQGNYYQLGASASNRSGVRGFTALSITDDVPNPAFTVTTDYIEYPDQGMIYIVKGGGIANGTNLLVDYTPVANTRTRVKSSDKGSDAYEIRFYPDNTSGEDDDWYIPKCRLSPSGDMALKSRDGPIDLNLTISIETIAGSAQLYRDGVPV